MRSVAGAPAGATSLTEVLDREGVRVRFGVGDGRLGAAAADLVLSEGRAVAAHLGLDLEPALEVHLVRTRASFEAHCRAIAGRAPPVWAIAVAYPRAALIVIHANRLEVLTGNALDPVLAHELAHLVLGGVDRALPRWLDEGLAMWAAGQRLTPAQQNRLGRAARGGGLPPLATLARDFPEHAAEAQDAYLQSLAAVELLVELYGADGLRAFLRVLSDGLPLEAGFERAFDAPLEGFALVLEGVLAERYELWRDVLSTEGLLAVAALLVVVAYIRYRVRRRRVLRAFDAQEAQDAAGTVPAGWPPPPTVL